MGNPTRKQFVLRPTDEQYDRLKALHQIEEPELSFNAWAVRKLAMDVQTTTEFANPAIKTAKRKASNASVVPLPPAIDTPVAVPIMEPVASIPTPGDNGSVD